MRCGARSSAQLLPAVVLGDGLGGLAKLVDLAADGGQVAPSLHLVRLAGLDPGGDATDLLGGDASGVELGGDGEPAVPTQQVDAGLKQHIR